MSSGAFLTHFLLMCLMTSSVVAATRHNEPSAVFRDAARLFLIFVGSVVGLSLVLLLFET